MPKIKQNFKIMKCPRCDYPRMKHWEELDGDEKFLAERLPLSAEFSLAERRKHLFCPRCCSEIVNRPPETA